MEQRMGIRGIRFNPFWSDGTWTWGQKTTYGRIGETKKNRTCKISINNIMILKWCKP